MIVRIIRSATCSLVGRVLALALIVTVTTVGGATAQRQAPHQRDRLVIVFGPAQVWQPSPAAIEQLHLCADQALTCVRRVMEQHGATPDAIAFYHLTGWFLSDIKNTGVVQVGTILNPWAANENEQLALLGGVPAVIFPNEDAATFGPSLPHNPTYAAIKARHKDAMYWPFGPTFVGTETSPTGGLRYLLDYTVLDGCHACAVLAHVRLAFDFTSDGTKMGVQLVAVIPEGMR